MSVSNGFLPSEDSSTVFTELKETFPLYDTEKLRTVELMEGSQGVVKVIERFGKVFAPVVFDMNRNIDKINSKYRTDETNFEFIEDMVLSEKENDGVVVTDALQWLRRALHFVSRLFHHILDNHDNGSITSDLTPMLKRAYSETLEPYHGWLGTQLFNVMSRFAPTIHCLYYTLALDKHNKVEHVIRDMRVLTDKIDGCVEKLRKFYEDNNLETYYRA
ncbi:pleckstrin homology domain-containing family A member 8 [Coccinella septempunctata]|uniref:pleckstrin homology domain-containing family A member 8 n=1 Tax=Coccinella septempunctata TaxID=41139 RepID=UPI001D05F309|nr:pleckstrin homology domain-containing family A member 8 [Coccinella septempunctata]